MLANFAPDELRCDALISDEPPTAGWLRAVGPAWVLLRDGGARDDSRPSEGAGTFTQSRRGALTLSIYPTRLEARGFLDGSKEVRRRAALPGSR